MFHRNPVLMLLRSGAYGWAALAIGAMLLMWLVGIYAEVFTFGAVTQVHQDVAVQMARMEPGTKAYETWAEGAWQWQIEQNPHLTPAQQADLAEQLGLLDKADQIRAEAGIGGCSARSLKGGPVGVGVPLGLVVALLGVIAVAVRQQGGRMPGLDDLVGAGGSPLKDLPPEAAPPSEPPPPEAVLRAGPASEPPPTKRVSLEEVLSTQEARSRDNQARLLDLVKEDESFSVPALLLFVHRLHGEVTRAAVSGAWDPLAPHINPGARRYLTKAHQGVEAVAQVVLGPMSIEVQELSREWVRLELRLTSTRFERLQGTSMRSWVQERWVLQRGAATRSPEPGVLLSLGCPGCGAPVKLDMDGCCTACRRNVSWGQFGWQISDVEYRVRRPLGQPSRAYQRPNPDHYEATSQVDPILPEHLAALAEVDPGFDPDRFIQRVGVAFTTWQQALSTGQWQRARPYLADGALGELRVLIADWEASGYRLVRRDALLDEVEIVRCTVDPWYAALVVRVRFSALEFTVDKEGLLAEGSDTERVGHSTYWTFARGTSMPETGAQPNQCSSCGHGLDRVSPEGVCGYCGADLASLEWDWMLVRTDGVEDYR